ncbi:hypothetical protein D3C81_2074520 [compost metagenome]
MWIGQDRCLQYITHHGFEQRHRVDVGHFLEHLVIEWICFPAHHQLQLPQLVSKNAVRFKKGVFLEPLHFRFVLLVLVVQFSQLILFHLDLHSPIRRTSH